MLFTLYWGSSSHLFIFQYDSVNRCGESMRAFKFCCKMEKPQFFPRSILAKRFCRCRKQRPALSEKSTCSGFKSAICSKLTSSRKKRWLTQLTSRFSDSLNGSPLTGFRPRFRLGWWKPIQLKARKAFALKRLLCQDSNTRPFANFGPQICI